MPLGSFSMGEERGLPYWPATRPMRTVGMRAPQVRMRDICRRILNFCSIGFCEQSWKRSAQSPPCRKKRWPAATSDSWCLQLIDLRVVDEGWEASEGVEGGVTGCGVFVVGLLRDGLSAPGVDGPIRGGGGGGEKGSERRQGVGCERDGGVAVGGTHGGRHRRGRKERGRRRPEKTGWREATGAMNSDGRGFGMGGDR